MELLAKLYDIEKAGRTLTKQYNVNSDLEDMEMEILYQTDLEQLFVILYLLLINIYI